MDSILLDNSRSGCAIKSACRRLHIHGLEPSACGTVVIFNSSGLTGGQSLRLHFARRFAATIPRILATQDEIRSLGARFLRFELDIKLCLVSSKLAGFTW